MLESPTMHYLTLEEVFSHIYENALWGDEETLSGSGSRLEETQGLIHILPQMLQLLKVERLLDLGCGDFYWMQYADLGEIEYHGIDLVPALIEQNQERFQGPGIRFSLCDATHDPLPASDAILMRNVLTHLSYLQIHRLLKNTKQYPFKYLFMTHYPEWPENKNIASGLWRPVNMTRAPFSLPKPLKAIPEYAEGASLGIWSRAQIEQALH